MTDSRARGWHPDPDDSALRAFWDGKRWRRRGTPPASHQPARRGDNWLVALAILGAFVLVSVVVAVLTTVFG